jgi:hypothetical protein
MEPAMSDETQWLCEGMARRFSGLSSGELRSAARAGKVKTDVSADGKRLYARADVVALRRPRRDDHN